MTDPTMPQRRDTLRIRQLNDAFRTSLSGGTVLMSRGVADLPPRTLVALMREVPLRKLDKDDLLWQTLELGCSLRVFKGLLSVTADALKKAFSMELRWRRPFHRELVPKSKAERLVKMAEHLKGPRTSISYPRIERLAADEYGHPFLYQHCTKQKLCRTKIFCTSSAWFFIATRWVI